MEKRKRIIVKAVVAAIFLIALYIILPYIEDVVNNPPGTAYISLPSTVNFKFEWDAQVRGLGNYILNVTIPTNSTYQEVYVSDYSNEPKNELNSYNRTWWSYSLSGYSSIKIVYQGETKLKIWNIKNSLDVNSIPQNLKKQYDHGEYLKNGDTKLWVIEPDKFESQQIGEKITEGKNNVLDKLRAIYDYIVNNFEYEKESGNLPKTAVETWNDKSGDCDELSFVFVSIARSIGIPAWVEYGILYTGSTWGHHAWIRTVVPTEKKLYYVNIDLTSEVGREDYGRGFLIRDPYRITEWQDDGNSTHLSSYYEFINRDLSYTENFKPISMEEGKKVLIPVAHTIPSWIMLLIIILIIVAVFVVIIRF